jgi:hypothetical protein
MGTLKRYLLIRFTGGKNRKREGVFSIQRGVFINMAEEEIKRNHLFNPLEEGTSRFFYRET